MKRLFSDGRACCSRPNAQIQKLLEIYFIEKDKIDSELRRAEEIRKIEKICYKETATRKIPKIHLQHLCENSDR